MPATDLREPIRAALAAFAAQPLPAAAGAFFRILGYSSDRTLSMGSVQEFCGVYDSDGSRLSKFNPSRTWRSLDLIFQLTSADIARGTSQQLSLLEAEPADLRQIESYLFFALELKPADDGKLRSRSELADVARAINRNRSIWTW